MVHVLVTGAAGAIGSATVTAFLEAGYGVVGVDIADQPGPAREGYLPVRADVRDADALIGALGQLQDRGPLAHVIGIAGGALPGEPETQDDPGALPAETFRSSVELNLTSQFLVLKAALPWLRGGGAESRSVTFTSSFNALSGQGMPAYSAAKAGLIGMMHALTGPLGAEGIRVNVVAPGTIRTPRTERLWSSVEGHFERLAAGTALGRLGEPQDVARAHLALATQLTHVTGQTLVVDGGQLTVGG